MNKQTKIKLAVIAALLIGSQHQRLEPWVQQLGLAQVSEIDSPLLLRELCRNMATALSSNEKINTSNRLEEAWHEAFLFLGDTHTPATIQAHQVIWAEVAAAIGHSEKSVDLDQALRDQAAAIFDRHGTEAKK